MIFFFYGRCIITRICTPKKDCFYSFCVCFFRQKLTHQFSQQVSTALQQWEMEAQRSEEQEEKFNVGSLFFFPAPVMELLMWYSKIVLLHNIQYYPVSWWCFHDMQSMFKQQLKILQQARVVQNQKLKMVRELYEQFVKVTMSHLRVYVYPQEDISVCCS